MRMLCLMCLLLSADVCAEEIPLGTVWAWGMPGTRDVREIESELFFPADSEAARATADNSAVVRLQQALRKQAGSDENRQGFVVARADVAGALESAAEAMRMKTPKHQVTESGNEVYICFFSRLFGSFVHLKKVNVDGRKITLIFEFVREIDAHQTDHFALVPLGILKDGEYDVTITAAPLRPEYVALQYKQFEDEVIDRIVCRSFVFRVGGTNSAQ